MTSSRCDIAISIQNILRTIQFCVEYSHQKMNVEMSGIKCVTDELHQLGPVYLFPMLDKNDMCDWIRFVQADIMQHIIIHA